MNDVETKVYVADTDFGTGVDVAIIREGGGISQIAKVDSATGALVFESFQQGTMIRPTIRLSRYMAKQLLAGLSELNLPLPSAGAIEGELKATKIHLEDMRHLLKLPKAGK